MEMECSKVAPFVGKAKKKQGKDELDRHKQAKQAEKKKRRLEKALAHSAAIRFELEKKKQKKKEEQQRLDEEGAAIAEAVALHVLLGEDTEDYCNIRLKNDSCPWDCTSNINLFMGGKRVIFPHQDFSEHSLEEIGWIPYARESDYEWGNSDSFVSPFPSNCGGYTPFSDEKSWGNPRISVDCVAAQAVASLQIGEDAHFNSYGFRKML